MNSTEIKKEMIPVEKRLDQIESKMKDMSEKIDYLMKEMEKRNTRGAGRKKDQEVAEKKKKAIEMRKSGKSREEIMKELEISITTYYRYIKEEV